MSFWSNFNLITILIAELDIEKSFIKKVIVEKLSLKEGFVIVIIVKKIWLKKDIIIGAIIKIYCNLKYVS